jgi:hypothetical protein
MALYYSAHLAFALFGKIGTHYKERFVLHGSALTAPTPSYAEKLVTVRGKEGGVSVTVRASHISKQGLIRHGRE